MDNYEHTDEAQTTPRTANKAGDGDVFDATTPSNKRSADSLDDERIELEMKPAASGGEASALESVVPVVGCDDVIDEISENALPSEESPTKKVKVNWKKPIVSTYFNYSMNILYWKKSIA
jgi:hypothetical protein